MSPLRAIPTSRAYWELRAEQVLNRVFEPERAIDVEVFENTTTPLHSSRGLHLQEQPQTDQTDTAASDTAQATRATQATPANPLKPGSLRQHPLARRLLHLSRQPTTLLAGASVSAMVLAGLALMVLGIWHQSQQAIRQERNLLLMERLRAMGPATTTPGAAELPAGDTTKGNQADAGLPPPPPDGEPWMEELATLPSGNAPTADVLRVSPHSRITSPAPPASGSGSGSGGSSAAQAGSIPQLVGVVQVPGQSGSAIFQIGGSSTSAAVGESIGGSGWRLRSASGDTAVIERGGEQRRITISSGF